MTHLFEQYGLIVLFVALTADSFALPLPGQTLLVAASIMAGQGKLDLTTVVAVGAFAAAFGNGIGYEIGRRGGPLLVAGLARRVRIPQAKIDRFHRLIEQRGAWLVLVARFIPVMREVNGLLAGAGELERARFWLANVLGAILWTVVIAGLADRFGASFDLVRLAHGHIRLIVAFLVAAAMAVVALEWWRRTRGRADDKDIGQD